MRGARGALVEELARRPHRPRAVRFNQACRGAAPAEVWRALRGRPRRPRIGPESAAGPDPRPGRRNAASGDRHAPRAKRTLSAAPNSREIHAAELPNVRPEPGHLGQPGNRTNLSTSAKLFEPLPRAAHGHANEPVSRDRGRGAASRPRRMADRARGARTDSGPASIELGPRLRSRDRRRRTRGRRTGRSCSRPPPCARA